MNKSFISFLDLFLFLIHCTLTSGQGPAAAPAAPVKAPAAPASAPAPAGPTDVTHILKKDGRFSIFIRLLQSTKVADNINTQLQESSTGMTIFAPTDSAFSSLKQGTLNSFTDDQKTQLIQFHILPTYLSPSQFQTASNPLTTQAGSSQQLFAMNVTAIGSSVNITTGETNASVVHTIYTDNQLAVYEVDKVLLPMRFYVPLPPPPPPPPAPKKATPKASPVIAPVSSSTKCLSKVVLHAMACVMLVLATFP